MSLKPNTGEPFALSTQLVLDINTPSLGYITINSGGELVASHTVASTLTCKGVRVLAGGSYKVGLAANPNPVGHNLVVDAPAPANRVLGASHDTNDQPRGSPNDAVNGVPGLARGVIVENNARFEWYAVTPTVHRTFLSDHANQGATTIKVRGTVNWKAGWKFVLGMTGFQSNLAAGQASTDTYTLASDSVPDAINNWTVLNLTSPVSFFRWGKIQYATDAGMSLTPGAFTKRASSSVPTILDESAEVALLTRTSTISAANDAEFNNNRFGVHIMKMGLTGAMIVKGVEIHHCGQGGALGRYPIHWHLSSYSPTIVNGVPTTGTFLGNLPAGSALIEDSSIHTSQNRGITHHACRGAVAKNNTIFDTKGHPMFFEDHSEMENTWDGNWVFKVRDPFAVSTYGGNWRIKVHDFQPAAFWVTNLNNTIINNRGSDAHWGRWCPINNDRPGFPGGCFGFSAQVAVHPFYRAPLLWSDNTFHSCFESGAQFQRPIRNEQGDTGGNNKPLGSPDGTAATVGTLPWDIFFRGNTPSVFSKETLWKNNGGQVETGGNESRGNYNNQISVPDYDRWIVADALGTDFSGATDFGKAHDILFVGKSLNIESIQNTTTVNRNGYATYHGALPFFDCTFLHYNGGNIRATNRYGSAIGNSCSESWDLYLNPYYFGTVYSTNLKYVDSLPIWRTPGPNLIRHTSTYSQYQTQGPLEQYFPSVGDGHASLAVLDYDGSLGGLNRPKSYLIFDQPFVATGLTDLATPVEYGVPSYQKVTNTTMIGIVTQTFPGIAFPNGPGGQIFYVVGGMTYQRCSPTTLADIPNASNVVNPVQAQHGNLIGSMGICPSGGAVRIFNSTGAIAMAISIRLENLIRYSAGGWTSANGWTQGDDYLYLGIPWPGNSQPASVTLSTGLTGGPDYPGSRIDPSWVGGSAWPGSVGAAATPFTNVGTGSTGKANLLGSTGGLSYYRDTANNMLWARVARAFPNGDGRIVQMAWGDFAWGGNGEGWPVYFCVMP